MINKAVVLAQMAGQMLTAHERLQPLAFDEPIGRDYIISYGPELSRQQRRKAERDVLKGKK